MDFKKLLPHIVAALVFFVAVLMAFGPEFQGKILVKGDITSYQATTKELKDYKRATGDRANWTTATFSGMPTYQMSTIRDGNQLEWFRKPLMGFMNGGAGLFFLGMLVCYCSLLLIGVNPWISLVAAVAAGFATSILVIYLAGHSSKTHTIFYIPLIASGALLAFRRRYFLGGLVFALGMGLAIMANHPQMLYYFGLTFPILGVFKFVEALRKKELVPFAKASGALVVGLGLAVGAGASNILTTLEYTPSSMRGGQVLETPLKQADNNENPPAAPTDGLSWDYAMRWSNDVKDLLATYAPLAAGGGLGQVFEDQSFASAMRAAGFGAIDPRATPAYHGGKIEGTGGPEYFGAVAWALFLFGLFTARRSVAVWMGLGVLLVMVISMGKYAPGINELLYNTVPLFNKFRAPSSALNVLPALLCIVGAVGVSDWLRTRELNPERATKQLLYAGITAAVAGLAVIFVLPAILGFDTLTDARLTEAIAAQKPGAIVSVMDGIRASRRALYSADAWRSFLYVGLTFGVLLFLWKKFVNPMVAGLLLLAILVSDISGINSRYLADRQWQTKAKSKVTVPMTPADQQILADKELNFRVLNATVNTWNDATTSYYHKSIGGYSAVKMRRYQDVIDAALGGTNPANADGDVLDMLNTKYVITSKEQVRQRPNPYGPAWIPARIETVSSNDAELAALTTIDDLKATAIVHEEFSEQLAGLNPTGQGSIQLTSHDAVEARYAFNSPTEQLVVFSEIWYGPNKGWNIYIDGKKGELVRANYILRAARVPAGQHALRMAFEPRSYRTGRLISLITSSIVIFGLVGYVFYKGYWVKRGTTPPVTAATRAVKTTAKTKKTRRK